MRPSANTEPILHTFDEPVARGRSAALKKILAGVGIFLLVFLVLGYFLLGQPILALMSSGRKLKADAEGLSQIAKSQDLSAIKKQLELIKTDTTAFQKDFSRLGWAKVVPFANNYYADGDRGLKAANDLIDAGDLAVTAIEPYADVIGLKGLATTGDGAKTAQDRIGFIVETLDKIKPQLSSIGEKLADAKTQIDKIDPNRYPEEFKGKKIRSQLIQGKLLLDKASELVNNAKPLLESAPYILGKDSPRKYLVIFENDAELRPTGGFMTGYAIIQVNKGKISTLESNDIYTLDEKFPKRITAPQPILKYMPNVPYWYLRDQNLSPDFKVSMDTFYPNYLLTKSQSVDGVIAVDTNVLVNLMKITGPIGVPGFGNFSPEIDKRCDCPNVFYQLQVLVGSEEPVIWDSISGKIIKAPANYGNRKGFLGPVMYSILANVMAQPKSKFPDLFNTIISSIDGKHVQFYFIDPKIQTAVESFNMAGRVATAAENQDYLMVVDTNFSGAKTNIWVKNKVDQDVKIDADGTVTKTVTITYTNPEPGSVQVDSGRKLNGLFRDWLRVYVPKGSKLIEAKGYETGQTTGEDLGKTTFEGFFSLAPLNLKTITLKYTLPFKIKSPYRILVQKQAGSKDFVYNFKINGHAQPENILTADKEFDFTY